MFSNSKRTETSFNRFVVVTARTDARNLAIFVVTTIDDRQLETDCFTPCACARGNNGKAAKHQRMTGDKLEETGVYYLLKHL